MENTEKKRRPRKAKRIVTENAKNQIRQGKDHKKEDELKPKKLWIPATSGGSERRYDWLTEEIGGFWRDFGKRNRTDGIRNQRELKKTA